MILPALYRIDVNEGGNTIRQLQCPSRTGEAAVSTLNDGRCRGLTICPSEGSDRIFLLKNSSRPPSEWTHVLRLRNFHHDQSAAEIDLGKAAWIVHSDRKEAPSNLEAYESHTAAMRASWTDAFQYKREDLSRNQDGLRPPQLGAIYAVQAHWTVDNDAATVILPTGVGKTETMLSLLVAERCERVLVVVPTDVTLQLVGRFTRAKPHLGNATFVANIADLEVKDELRKLYRHDSDRNALLPLLSEGATSGELSLWEFLGGFQESPDALTLRNVRPAMSMVVYRTRCKEWSPDGFSRGIPGFRALDRVYHTLNPQEKTLIIVTTRRVPVDWAHVDEIHNWDWQLYVLHWDSANSLLFIHNSSNAGFFRDLAQAVAGPDVEQIRGPTIFRCLSAVNRLKLQNVGLLEQLGRLIRCTMRAGSDVEPGMSEAQKQKAIKAKMFGQGFENGHRSSIGCSYRGRIWSYRTTNLLQLTTWCRGVGKKLLDSSLDPEEVLRGTLVPTLLAKRPSKTPVAVEWPELFYKEPEQAFSFQIDGRTIYRHEADLAVIAPSDQGPLKFALISESDITEFELKLFESNGAPDYKIEAKSDKDVRITHRSRSVGLEDLFNQEPPTFWFADGSSLTGNEYVELRNKPEPFPRNRIEEWDWAGTNITMGSQGSDRNPQSIQYRVIGELKKRQPSVLYDDDDHGESADVVAITEKTDEIEVEFWHCKFAMRAQPASRIKEFYELCGQVQKSIRWLEKPRDLFTHLMRRNPRNYKGRTSTRYEIGMESDLLRIREKADSQRVLLKIFIVQPGLSKSVASREQLELLAVTENYLLETFAVPFAVVGSA